MALPQFKILGNPDTYDEKTYPILLGKAQFTEDYLAGKKTLGRLQTCNHRACQYPQHRCIESAASPRSKSNPHL